jgi:hypothetical protein
VKSTSRSPTDEDLLSLPLFDPDSEPEIEPEPEERSSHDESVAYVEVDELEYVEHERDVEYDCDVESEMDGTELECEASSTMSIPTELDQEEPQVYPLLDVLDPVEHDSLESKEEHDLLCDTDT